MYQGRIDSREIPDDQTKKVAVYKRPGRMVKRSDDGRSQVRHENSLDLSWKWLFPESAADQTTNSCCKAELKADLTQIWGRLAGAKLLYLQAREQRLHWGMLVRWAGREKSFEVIFAHVP